MRGCLFRFWMGRCPRRLVATALMLFACSSASLKALTLPGVSWSAVYEFTNGLYLDESGNGNTLSAFTGSPAFVPDRSGSSSSAFLGSTGTILGRSGALVGFNPLSNQLSLSAWIKTSSSGKEVIATMGRNPTSNEGEWIWGISNGQLYFWDYRGGYGFVETSVSTTSVNNGQWRHVAFVRNELTGTFYIDGTPAGTVTAAKNVSYTNSDLVIGGDYRDAELHWTGQLDDVSVSSTALTPDQIVLAAFPFSYTTGTDGGLTITGYTGAGGNVEIPATIGGVPVTKIGDYVFQSKSDLTGVIIPNGVTTIGANAFADCANLASVTLPSSVTLIMSGAFFLCPKLTTISIPNSVNEIQYNAFLNCSMLGSVYFQGNTPPAIVCSNQRKQCHRYADRAGSDRVHSFQYWQQYYTYPHPYLHLHHREWSGHDHGIQRDGWSGGDSCHDRRGSGDQDWGLCVSK